MLKEDSLPLRLIPKLREQFPNISFVEFDPNDNLEKEGRNLIIIDCVQGIRSVKTITDIDKIVTQKVYSMHDFDLGYSLKLLKKLGYLKSVIIFGVPMKADEKVALMQLTNIIKTNLKNK